MALNFNLLAQAPNLGAQFAAGQDAALQAQQARQQMAAQQQQMAAQQQQMTVSGMQMQKMQREEAALANIAQTIHAKGGPADLGVAADQLIASGNQGLMDTGIKLKQAIAQNVADREAMGLPPVGGAPAAATGAAPAGPAPTNALAPEAPPAAAPTNAMIPGAAPAAGADKEALIRQAKMMLLSQNPGVRTAGEQQLKRLSTPDVLHTVAPGGSLVGPSGNLLFAAPEKKPAPSADMQGYELAKAEGFTGTFFDFKRQLAQAGRAPAQPRAESPPVAVVDDATGKIKYVTREQAMGMTPAAATENLAPKEIQKREAVLPQATSAVKGFETKSDSFVKDLTALRNHPGLSSITGIAAGRLPGLTAEGRAAQALYDKVMAKGGFQALQDLREASKTGGALGNVSNQEGKQLTASFAAIDRRQDAEDVRSALDQAIADVQNARTRMRETYDSTYSYKSGQPSAATAAPPKSGGWGKAVAE